MFDIESLMQQHVEPKDMRKKPKGLQKWLSFLWPQRVLFCASEHSGQLHVLAWKGKYLLDTTNVNYSFGSLHRVMEQSLEELKAKEVVFDRVLLLGYGGGSAAEIIHQKYQRDAEIVGVEWDSVVVELAKSHFYTKGVRLLHENAFDYIKKAMDNSWQYDLIVVDLFVDDIIPEAAFREDFFQQLASVASGGAVLVNAMKIKQKSFSNAEKLGAIAQKYFKHVSFQDVTSFNRVLICK